MECPYCKKEIYAMTGFQELVKFQKHLRKCKKNPANAVVVTKDGDLKMNQHNATFEDALNIRHESGQ